ncbi:hypothetical protein MPSEU_001077400 [Mayamaea pseudoterrestris]|nr:hypothetical protein MPSEU_001077400 [Mayamaea pseudoterrestris]
MTAPSLFRAWGKKTKSGSKAATESLEPQKVSKPQLLLPKGLSRRTSNETYPDSSSNGDFSTTDSVVSLDDSPSIHKKRTTRTVTLQARLNSLVSSRHCSTETIASLNTAYNNTAPTSLQQASYHVALQQVNASQLHEMLQAGLSPNPVSAQHNDSFLHWVCRQGRHDLLQVLLQHGCRLQVCNASGRTPLHEACASVTPNFLLVETLLKHDAQQCFLTDANHMLPLALVKRELRREWMDFLVRVANDVWPSSGNKIERSLLLRMPPNASPILDPIHALTPQVAAMVAARIMEPQEAVCLRYERKEDNDDYNNDNHVYPDVCEQDDSSESDFSLDENELSEILTLMSVPASA